MTLEEVTTLKEAIKRLKEVIKEVRSTIQPFLYDNEAKDYILKALEKESCEDAVSRTDVLELIEDINDTVFGQVVSKGVMNLPSVRPKEKVGHWVNLNKDNIGRCDDYGSPYVECSICHEYNGTEQTDYCPNCGARMVGSAE